jgi:NAD(P)-dependent dehydrogenase (short-subunit alcohol dehydrogenase family)
MTNLDISATPRTHLVTGAASGIGRATAAALRDAGERVITLDLHSTDVVADLSTAEGRLAAIHGVTAAADGSLDAIIACAGTAEMTGMTMRVNYFGTIALLEGLRPLLAASPTPRAVVISSVGVLFSAIDAAVEACLAGDEEAAVAAAETSPILAYPSSKRALARWVRRAAPSPEWAGAGIALNASGPGGVETPMIQALLDDPAGIEMLDSGVPMPLSGHARPDQIVPALLFLTSAENTLITGQMLFVDGGADAVIRGDDIW